MDVETQHLLGANNDRHITCGIELELLLTPKITKIKKDNFPIEVLGAFDGLHHPGKILSRFEAIAKILETVINRPWFKSLGYDPSDDVATKASKYAQAKHDGTLYQYWTVTYDLSIDKTHKDQIGIEIVSRVFKPTFAVGDGHGNSIRWSDELRMVWDVLESYFEVETHSSCGTHVHFKIFQNDPNANPTFSMADIKTISKAIVYWNPLVDNSVPAERTSLENRGIYLRDNLTHYNGYDYPNCPGIVEDYQVASKVDPPQYDLLFDIIDSKTDTGYTYMKDFTRKWTTAELKEAESSIIQYMSGPEKYMAWNFLNLTDSPLRERPTIPSLGTIEFRLPPGSASYGDAQHWISFLLTFAALSFLPHIPSTGMNLKSSFNEFKLFMEATHKVVSIEGTLNIERYQNAAMN